MTSNNTLYETTLARFSRHPIQSALALASFVILCVTLWGYTSLHIWYPDDATYLIHGTLLTQPSQWITNEGRWLQYLSLPFIVWIGGRIALYLDLFLLFLFIFIVTWRYIANVVYAFAFAVLCLSTPALVYQMLTPSIIFASIAVLLIAALVARMLPIYIFYVVFGILLMGCTQNFYYLLPLVHLHLFTKQSLSDNLRILMIHIAPAWIGGYIVGCFVMLFVVYVYTFVNTGDGQIGLQIQEWRKSEYDYQNLKAAISRSAEYLVFHLGAFTLYNKGIMVIAAIAFVFSLLGESRHLPVKLLLAGIVLSHYILIIPVGVIFHYRTAIPAAIGFAALLFLASPTGRLKEILHITLLLCMSAAWSFQTIKNLRFETSIPEIFFSELLRLTPKSPKYYNGVALLNGSQSIKKTTLTIMDHLELLPSKDMVPPHRQQGRFTGIRMKMHVSSFFQPVAYEAGFKYVQLCGDFHGGDIHAQSSLCREIAKSFPMPNENKTPGFYNVLGEYNGFLVLSIGSFNQPTH